MKIPASLRPWLLCLAVQAMIFYVSGAFAQPADKAAELLLRKKSLNCNDMLYNGVVLIPQLYRNGSADTLDALTRYWGRLCPMSEPLFSFVLLRSIRERTFDEHLYKAAKTNRENGDTDFYQQYLFDYLREYRTNHNKYKYANSRPDPAISDEEAAALQAYYSFLDSLAIALCDLPGLSPIERYLAEVYARPDSMKVRLIQRAAYKNTDAARLYSETWGKEPEIKGAQLCLTMGMWSPTGPLSVLRNRFTTGITSGYRGNKLMIDADISLRFGSNHRNNNIIDNNDTLYPASFNVGAYMGIDVAYELYRHRRHELDVLGGCGLDLLTMQFGQNNSQNTYRSLNLNAGLGYKFLYRHVQRRRDDHTSYLALQIKYNFLNYNNPGGAGVSDYTGNALTATVLYGFYSHRIRTQASANGG